KGKHVPGNFKISGPQRSSASLPPSSSGWATGAAPGQPLLGCSLSLASIPSRCTPPLALSSPQAELSCSSFSCCAITPHGWQLRKPQRPCLCLLPQRAGCASEFFLTPGHYCQG
ncbi:hypothetical protein EJB05_44636, partial [Eragrostis curvula]